MDNANKFENHVRNAHEVARQGIQDNPNLSPRHHFEQLNFTHGPNWRI